MKTITKLLGYFFKKEIWSVYQSNDNTSKIFSKRGYKIDHQTGSHVILRQMEEPHRRLTIPNHYEISKGTLRAIIRQAGVTREEFEELIS